MCLGSLIISRACPRRTGTRGRGPPRPGRPQASGSPCLIAATAGRPHSRRHDHPVNLPEGASCQRAAFRGTEVSARRAFVLLTVPMPWLYAPQQGWDAAREGHVQCRLQFGAEPAPASGAARCSWPSVICWFSDTSQVRCLATDSPATCSSTRTPPTRLPCTWRSYRRDDAGRIVIRELVMHTL